MFGTVILAQRQGLPRVPRQVELPRIPRQVEVLHDCGIAAPLLVEIVKSPEFQQSFDNGTCADSDTGALGGCDIECMASFVIAGLKSEKWDLNEKGVFTFGPNSTDIDVADCIVALDVSQIVQLSNATGLSVVKLTQMLPCVTMPTEREKWMTSMMQSWKKYKANQKRDAENEARGDGVLGWVGRVTGIG